MKLAARILEGLRQVLDEKLIIVNKGKKNGQVIYLAGGAGSGKGFAVQNFIDVNSYKRFDVDELKQRLINLAKVKGINPELANLNLKNPDDVFKLHMFVKERGLADKMVDNLLKNVNKDKGLPNLLFDVTLKDMSHFQKDTEKLIEFGYKPEDIHVIWVLADVNVAFLNNQERERVVPKDVFFQTHRGAATSMSQILKGNLPSSLKGEVYVLLSDKDLTVLEADPKTGDPIVGKSKFSGKETFTVKDFVFFKVKDAGKKLLPDEQIQNQIFAWARKNVPKEVKKLFR